MIVEPGVRRAASKHSTEKPPMGCPFAPNASASAKTSLFLMPLKICQACPSFEGNRLISKHWLSSSSLFLSLRPTTASWFLFFFLFKKLTSWVPWYMVCKAFINSWTQNWKKNKSCRSEAVRPPGKTVVMDGTSSHIQSGLDHISVSSWLITLLINSEPAVKYFGLLFFGS